MELEDDDMEAFIDNIHEYYENFDVDEEAYIWIGSDGHGKNGAPYHIADIVKDMEEAEIMMADLYHPKLFRQSPLRHSALCLLWTNRLYHPFPLLS